MLNRKQKGWRMGTAMLLGGLFLFILLPASSPAQTYPTKPISILVVFGPGGSSDTMTRVLSSKAEKMLGQPISVENNGGGGGTVGLGIIAKARPDGYKIAQCVSIGLIGIPQFRAVTYTLDDFVPIMQYATGETGLAVRADAPFKTLKEFVEYAKKNPGKVTYSTTAIGSTTHLVMEYIGKKEGITWTHVPFPGFADCVTALLGGHVTAVSGDTTWIPYVKEGTLRLLGNHGEKRMKIFPNVPTFREQGYDYVNPTTYVIVAPKGTPQPIVKKLEEAYHKAMDDPDFTRVADQLNNPIFYRNSEDTMKFLRQQYVGIGKMISDFNIPTELNKGPAKK
jgi:tripartite-type tricarboxylate transporter receptor subunit TctC